MGGRAKSSTREEGITLKPGDRIVLELTDEQAVVLERAVELLFRLHIGQFNEIKFALLKHVDETIRTSTHCSKLSATCSFLLCGLTNPSMSTAARKATSPTASIRP